MADDANKPSQPKPEEVPAPSQDGMINAKPEPVPKPPGSTVSASEPAHQGQVDDEAAVDVKPAAESLENPAPTPPAESASQPKADPTVAQLDKSHESELNQPVQEPETKEEPPKKGPAPKKKQSNILLAAVVAILVTMLLVGIGFAAWQASTSDEEAQQTGEDSVQTTEDTFDSEDANEFEQELDQLESDLQQLETDLDETGVDDEALGL